MPGDKKELTDSEQRQAVIKTMIENVKRVFPLAAKEKSLKCNK